MMMPGKTDYMAFLAAKMPRAQRAGFDPPSPVEPALFPHQRDICQWACRGGRRAIFANFGLGKTRMHLQQARWVHEHTGGRYLIVAPLGVRQEFTQSDGPAMGMHLEYVRTNAEVVAAKSPYLITNYERVRDGDISLDQFAGAGLDEASELTEQEWWIIGRWVADGHIGTRGDFYISVGDDKWDVFQGNAGLFAGAFAQRKSCKQVRLQKLSRDMIDMLHQCGKGAENKMVPSAALKVATNFASAFLNGYLSGAGYLLASRKRWMVSSVSRVLLMGLQLVIQRVHGAIASIHAGRSAGTAVIEGRTVNTLQEWNLSFQTGGYSFGLMCDDGAWKRVKKVELKGECEVWDIQVAEDESFTAEGCIVHNCPLQIDIIKRLITRYSNDGEVVYDPFMGIGSVAYQALKMGRHTVGTELNEEYWRFSVGYAETVEAEMDVPTLFDLSEFGAFCPNRTAVEDFPDKEPERGALVTAGETA